MDRVGTSQFGWSRRFFVLVLAGAAVLVASGSAQAAINSADFREELNFFPPFCDNARVLEAIGRAVGPGPELGEADEIANPCGYGDSIIVDFDPTTNLLTLTPSDYNNYQIIDIFITNIQFDTTEMITGLIPLSDNLIDVASSGPFSRSTSFTPDSITIGYVIDNPSNPDDRLEFGAGTAVFEVELGSVAIPVLSRIGIGTLIVALLGAGIAIIVRSRLAG